MKSSNCTKECRKGEKRSITGKTIHSNQDVIHAAEMQRNGPMPSQGLLRIKHRKNRQREVCHDEEIAHLPKGAISTVLIQEIKSTNEQGSQEQASQQEKPISRLA